MWRRARSRIARTSATKSEEAGVEGVWVFESEGVDRGIENSFRGCDPLNLSRERRGKPCPCDGSDEEHHDDTQKNKSKENLK
jgi:hypothetical protein